ncbi:MBL fold metallo-hydrolase [Phytohabitans rumicis]|uniref:MBL fold metallo-hydrolase n=1 Tax=Phytohabitans rumicis TaxID=1076125 RepID=UPI001563E2E2|nr:MBL fold metallo-hydrolase [Phytohabitans rumicis]
MRLEHIGVSAHTDSDVVVWLPDRGVLFTGDLVFNGGTPMLVSGSVTGYLQALERIEAFGAQVLVPGHGEPCDARVLDPLRRYTRFVLAAAKQGHAAELSPLQPISRTWALAGEVPPRGRSHHCVGHDARGRTQVNAGQMHGGEGGGWDGRGLGLSASGVGR